MRQQRFKQPWNVQELTQERTGEAARERRYRVCVNYPCQFSVRMTPQERKFMAGEAKAAGMSLSRYVVRAITQRRYPASVGDKEALFFLRFQLEKAGVNLNQIARRLNAQARSGAAPGLPGPALSEVRGAVHALRRVCREVERRMT